MPAPHLRPSALTDALPDTAREVVARGTIEGGSADAAPLPYALWQTPSGQVWVDIGGPEGGVRVPAATVGALDAALREHFPGDASRVVSVGVEDGVLSMGLRQSVALESAWVLVAAAVAVTAVALLVVAARRARRRAEVLREVAAHQTAGREAERAHVARELHDGPVQDLSVIAMEVAGMAAPEAEDVREGLRRVSRDLRSLAEGLRPPVLDRFGLREALVDLADRMGTGPRPLAVEVEAGAVELCPEEELVLYRVAQEALTNAAKHGGARRARVTLTGGGGGVALSVVDDGVGFGARPTVDQLVRAGHFGLAGMRERMRTVRGTLRLGAAPGGGAVVTAGLPPRAYPPGA